MAVLAYCYMRLSTSEQLSGTGEQRQLDMFEKYITANGLRMAGEVLNDRGISAFKGSNVSDGELGKFLEAIDKGQVEPGSYLLVESLDRLTRQAPLPAIELVIKIISRGINLVTLSDGRVQNAKNFDIGSLIGVAVEVGRSNSESVMKSQRIGKAWAAKRAAVREKKLTSRCPAWLQPIRDGQTLTSFRIHDARAGIVRRIFEESATGIGNMAIATRLNREKIAPFGRSKTKRNGRVVDKPASQPLWHPSSVAKILASRAVLGEFQAHRLTAKNTREPVGDVIKDYYPPVIDTNLFYRAQNARSQRRVGGSGRRGLFVSNLFSGLAKCAYCGSNMVFADKGRGPKGGRYLTCTASRRGGECKSRGWRYDDFEASFLTFVNELDLASILNDGSDAQQRQLLRKSIDSLIGQRDELRFERSRIFELLKRPELSTDYVVGRLAECERNLKAVDQQIDSERATLSRVEQSSAEIGRSDMHMLLRRMADKENSDVYRTRATIASRLNSLVEGIYLAPLGSQYWREHPSPSTSLMREKDESGAILVDYLAHSLPIKQTDAYFTVALRGDKLRVIYPEKEDPTLLSRSILSIDGKAEIVRKRNADAKV